jgi:hypothetical protein
MSTNHWAAYGKWRSGVYLEIELSELTAIYQIVYRLPDLLVISAELRPFHGIVRVECGFPGRDVD